MRMLLLLASCLMLSSCLTPTVNTSVTTFNVLPQGLIPGTVGIVPADPNKAGTLEFASYASRVEAQLRARGVSVVSPPQKPDFGLILDYGIDDGTQVTTTSAIPMWGQTGVASSQTFGTINTYGRTATVNATTTYTPTYGVTGYMPVTNTDTVYNRFVSMVIYDIRNVDQSKWSRSLETRLLSKGTCGNINEVFDEFLEAIFRRFPDDNGASRQEAVSGNFNC